MCKLTQHLSLLLVLIFLTLFFLPAHAEPEVEDQGMDLMDHHLHYPVLKGLENPEVQEKINQAVLSSGNIAELTQRLAVLISSPVPLNLSYRYCLGGTVFSCVLEADGPLTSQRQETRFASVNVYLENGESFLLNDLFEDPDEGSVFLESFLETEIMPELSPLLTASALTPLPDAFLCDHQGITLFYPQEQYTTLSGRAGSVHLNWQELKPVLNLAPSGLPAAFGALDALFSSSSTADALRETLSSGMLPGLPVHLGDSMTEVIERYGMLHDPDDYDQGRMFSLEDARFRGVFVLTDGLSRKSVDSSRVLGLRSDRFQAAGILCGETTRAQWQAVLGQPDTSVAIDSEQAAFKRLDSGISDYYTVGEYRLCLHSGKDDILESVFLIP